ncbi:MAG: hypothetical protein IKP36_00840 [Bacteroidaceae bacterium]|nr:hypothetical protein [Bacteroidaceae bacterium]
MKKQILALALLCCFLFGFAKDKSPINYRFHKNDTITLLMEKESDGIKSSTKSSNKLQIIVLEAKGSKALLKLNYFDPKIDVDYTTSKDPKLGFLQNKEEFFTKILSKMVPPIIQFENGKPKSMKNFKEVKASITEIWDGLFDTIVESFPDSLKEDSTMLGVTQFIKPMLDALMTEFMTEETLLAGYSDFIITDLPTKLGESSKGDEKAVITSSFLATEAKGEYAYQRTEKANLSKKDLKESNENKDSAISEFTSLFKETGALGALATAFLDSMSIDNKKSGVLLSNGIPKHLVSESRVKFSIMGETKETYNKLTISVIEK